MRGVWWCHRASYGWSVMYKRGVMRWQGEAWKVPVVHGEHYKVTRKFPRQNWWWELWIVPLLKEECDGVAGGVLDIPWSIKRVWRVKWWDMGGLRCARDVLCHKRLDYGQSMECRWSKMKWQMDGLWRVTTVWWCYMVWIVNSPCPDYIREDDTCKRVNCESFLPCKSTMFGWQLLPRGNVILLQGKLCYPITVT